MRISPGPLFPPRRAHRGAALAWLAPRGRAAAWLLMIVVGLALGGGRCALPQSGKERDAGAGEDGSAAAAASRTDRKARRARLEPLAAARRVLALSLRGPLDLEASQPLSKLAGQVEQDEALVVILDSVGGTEEGIVAALGALERCKGQKVVLVAGQAQGVAALLPMASPVVVLSPGARWGAVGPNQFNASRLSERAQAGLLERLRGLAEANGRPVDWALGMFAPLSEARRRLEGLKKGRPGRGTGEASKDPSGAARGRKAGGADRADAGGPDRADAGGAKVVGPRGASGKEANAPAPPADRRVILDASGALRVGMADAVLTDLQALARHVGWKVPVVKDGQPVAVASRAPEPEPRKDPRAMMAGVREVIRLDVKGTIELGLRSFMLRVLSEAKAGQVVVLDIDTFGGRVDAATEMRDALLRTKAKTVAFINPRAISAGALITLACDLIAMVPGGSFGAATPVQSGGAGPAKPVGEKYVSYMRKEFKSTAESKGRRGDIAEAMVDMSVEVEGVPDDLKRQVSGLQAGKLLTLTTEEAMKLGMADLRVKGFGDLMGRLGLPDAPVVRPEVSWAEQVSRFLTGPIVSGLLMTFGMLGLLLELYTPGFGVSGGIGVTCLLLFFFGHRIAGLAGLEPMLLFGLGALLIAAEVFVTPGFGIMGSLGVLAVVASLVWTLVGTGGVPITVSWEAGYVTRALVRVFIVVIVVAVLLVAAVRYLPRGRGPFRGLVLTEAISGDASAGAHRLPDEVASLGDLVGQQGVAETALRPSGRVLLGNQRLEAESSGPFIEKGAVVKVVRVEGRMIEVREVRS